MFKQNNHGFTLIELLVVIAIIGVLASIVIAAVTSSRVKAHDASIKANLNSLKIAIAIYRDDNDNYGQSTYNTDCLAGDLVTDPDIAAIIDAAKQASGNDPLCVLSDSNPSTQDDDPGVMVKSWAISIPLKSNVLTSWCVDSSGASKVGFASLPANEVAFCY